MDTDCVIYLKLKNVQIKKYKDSCGKNCVQPVEFAAFVFVGKISDFLLSQNPN